MKSLESTSLTEPQPTWQLGRNQDFDDCAREGSKKMPEFTDKYGGHVQSEVVCPAERLAKIADNLDGGRQPRHRRRGTDGNADASIERLLHEREQAVHRMIDPRQEPTHARAGRVEAATDGPEQIQAIARLPRGFGSHAEPICLPPLRKACATQRRLLAGEQS